MITLPGLVICVVTILILAISQVICLWALYQHQVVTLRELLAEERKTNSRLVNLISSRDPMTYATLQANDPTIATSQSYSPYEFSPVGTDQDEWARQQKLLGREIENDRADIDEYFGGIGSTS